MSEQSQLVRGSLDSSRPVPTAHDMDYPPVPVRLRYCILSAPRCGSTMLSSALGMTQCAGSPFEYLNRKMFRSWLTEYGGNEFNLSQYLGAVERIRTTPNGLFGLKVHYRQLVDEVGHEPKAVVEFLKRQDRLILITRQNKLAQAVSNVRAEKSSIWNLYVGQEPVVEKMEWSGSLIFEISRSLAVVVGQEMNWRNCLKENELPFLEVSYENFLADYSNEFARVLTHLDLDRTLALTVKPQTQKVGVGNDEIIDRYLSSIGAPRGR